MTPAVFAEGFWARTVKCGAVYNEKFIKVLIVEAFTSQFVGNSALGGSSTNTLLYYTLNRECYICLTYE